MTDPQMIGHYRIVRLLGTGAMGKVHAATDTFLERDVAIKSLRAELTQDPDFVGRFRAEATSLARLNHPNITTLYSPVLDGKDLYMVMELVNGRPLDEILKERGKPLGVKESLAVMAQAADGLAYAHQMGVIHRDIKPSNLMVADDGRIKIMDFGIARVRGSVRLTRVGTAVGTPLYMSPEQCRGGEGDERSDLYSLAIVLYEMLSGAPPFSGETEHYVTQAQIHAEAPPLVPRISGVTPELESAIMTALSKRPEQRFPNMRAFSDALGATAMRIDAASIIRNAGHLVQDSTAERDVPTPERLSTKLVALAKSRSATLVRRFKGLHPAAQGVTVGAGMVLILASLYFGLEPFFSSDERVSREISLPDKKSRSDDFRKQDANAGNRRAAPRNSSTFGVDENQASDVPLDYRSRRPSENSVSASSGSITDLRNLMRDSDEWKDSSLQWDTAFKLAQRLAQEGDKDAQYYLGKMYVNAPGHQKLSYAYQWFKTSAEAGHPEAQAALAKLYWNGDTAEGENLEEAVRWFTKAADQSNADGLFGLGLAFELGKGVPKHDYQKAGDYYRLAAMQGHAKARGALETLRKRRLYR
ncbi:MAG: serine/threonine protein kinase [Alphaproteobacteria bacterium]|nr:serine/threonine protein kinase [Alphaproteobacteria bacterium]